MSTKIYSGFIIDAGSAQANLALLSSIKEPVQRLVNKKHFKTIQDRAVALLDKFYAGKLLSSNEAADTDKAEHKDGPLADYSAWAYCGHQVEAEQRKCRQSLERSPFYDCDVELFLRMHPETGALLGYLQEERVGVYDYLLTVDGIREYGYWNNSDQPDEVSEQEWEKRGQDWKLLLDGPFAVFCVKWEPISWDDSTVAGSMPSLQKRAQNLASEELIDRAIRAQLSHEATHKPNTVRSASFAGVSRAMQKAQTEMDTEGAALNLEFKKLCAHYEQVLLPQLTQKVLQTHWSKLPERSACR